MCTGIPPRMRGSQQVCYAIVNIADDPSTSAKNLNFGPLTPEFCRLVSSGRATRRALSRFSSGLTISCSGSIFRHPVYEHVYSHKAEKHI